MTLEDKIKKAILGFTKIEHLDNDPNDDRYTYISDEDKIKKEKIKECKVWYIGDSSELLNYYTAMQSYGNAENPIYNRNKAQYFWGLSASECDIKRIHSGIPQAIVNTLVNVIGTPKITSETKQQEIDDIIKKTGLTSIINQKQMPMTLSLGYGAFKVIVDKEVCKDSPLIEWYNADDVEFIVKHGKVIGIIYKDYYRVDKKDYVLIEIRRIMHGDSYIEYCLCRLEKNNEVSEVPLDTLEETKGLSQDGLCIKGLDRILGVPSVFFYDNDKDGYGKSILANKIDLFDDLDQDLSQASQTSRVSTPVEYYPADTLERNANGGAKLPHIYNRQFIASSDYPDGDGHTDGQIITTQPQLNFNQYTDKCRADLDFILTGILSPATMGIEVAKKDNAEAQREKEKITIMTRNNVIDRQTFILTDLMELCLALKEYMTTGTISLMEYDIGIKFDEFANPSFENIAQSLLPLYQAQAMSVEMFIDRLYGDSLSDEEKQAEIEKLQQAQQQDDLDMNSLFDEQEPQAQDQQDGGMPDMMGE